MLAWWLWVGGLSVLVLPLVALGWDGLLMVLSMISSTGTAGRLLSRGTSELRDVGLGASQIGMQLYMTGLLDVLTFSGLVRGIWGVVNWVYQCVYFGLRMWLVFVLHAFSVGCFMSLWDGFAGAMGLGVLALGGILGAAVVLGGMCLGYLGIQVYVYVSFMCSFLYYCTMGWYRGEPVDVDSRSGRVVVTANANANRTTTYGLPSVSVSCFGLVKSSRSMYGGRNSVLVAGLPTWVCMIVVCFGMFAGLGFGAVADTLLLGMVWVVLGWVSVGAREKALISGGTIDRAGTLTAFAWLLLFEVAFFFGAVWVLWVYCLDGGYGCVGFGSEGVDSGVGSLGRVELLTTGITTSGLLIGAITLSTVGGSLTIVQVPVIGSLIILLLVTLLMQLVHREVIIHAGVLSVSTNTRLVRVLPITVTHGIDAGLVSAKRPSVSLVLVSLSFCFGLFGLLSTYVRSYLSANLALGNVCRSALAFSNLSAFCSLSGLLSKLCALYLYLAFCCANLLLSLWVVSAFCSVSALGLLSHCAPLTFLLCKPFCYGFYFGSPFLLSGLSLLVVSPLVSLSHWHPYLNKPLITIYLTPRPPLPFFLISLT